MLLALAAPLAESSLRGWDNECVATLQEPIRDALTYLPSALGEPFSDHPLADLLVRELPAAMDQVVGDPGYKLQGSRGRGRWAETVWVAAFDRLVTETGPPPLRWTPCGLTVKPLPLPD